jgi:valyl-tRNA synthetase
MLWFNRYIVSACHQLVADVTQQLDSYTMGQAGDQIQTFLWYCIQQHRGLVSVYSSVEV